MKLHLLSFIFCLLSSVILGQRVMPITYSSENGTSEIYELHEFQGDLYIAGRFGALFGSEETFGLVKWDGTNTPTQVGDLNSSGDRVFDIIEFDDLLYVAVSGDEEYVAYIDENDQFVQIGETFDDQIVDLVIFQNELYACGEFEEIGSEEITSVAKWNGNSWEGIGSFDDEANMMEVYGDRLYLAGDFSVAEGSAFDHIATWDGTTLEGVASGLNSRVTDLMVYEDELWITGDFSFDMDSTVEADRFIIWDGAEYYVPYDIEEYSGFGRRVVHVPGYGPALSGGSGEGSIVNPHIDNGTVIPPYGLYDAMFYNDELIIAGQFEEEVFTEIDDIAYLLPGHYRYGLEVAGISAEVNALGEFYDHRMNQAAFEVPADSGTHTIFSTSFFSVGIAEEDTFMVRGTYPYAEGNDFPYPPPIADELSFELESEFYQIYPMSNGAVWNHLDSWTEPGYAPSALISEWPGSHDPISGEPETYAPYEDVDGNGVYDPLSGDVPKTKGDASVLTIRSDLRSDPIGDFGKVECDFISTTYGYDTQPGDPLHQVLFSEVKVVNRSDNTYEEFYIGGFIDIDIGNPEDDFMGCDPGRNMVFGYNADELDEGNSGIAGYGVHPAAQAVVALDQDLYASHQFLIFQDYYANDLPGLVLGFDEDGEVKLDDNGAPTRYLYYGDPTEAGSWSENNQNGFAEDHRAVYSIGPWTDVAPGDTVCFEVAYVFAQDLNGDQLASVSLLQERVDAVQAWYDSNALGCGEYVVLSTEETALNERYIEVFPNPSSGRFRISWADQEVERIELRDLRGKSCHVATVSRSTRSLEVDQELAPGVYLITLSGAGSHVTERIVID